MEKNGACLVESPQKAIAPSQKVEVIVDLDSTMEMAPSQTSAVQSNMLKMCLRTGNQGTGGDSQANGSESAANQNGTVEPTSDTVDLTLSDSEEEDDDDASQRNRNTRLANK